MGDVLLLYGTGPDGTAIPIQVDQLGSLLTELPENTYSGITLVEAALDTWLASRMPAALGQLPMAGSLAVAIASDQSDVPTDAHLWNGISWDPAPSSQLPVLLASAVRNATTSSATSTNVKALGCVLYFNLSLVPTVDTVQLKLWSRDPIDSGAVQLWQDSARSTGGRFTFLIHPDADNTNGLYTSYARIILPRTYFVQVVHVGVGSFTYTVSACLLP